MTDTLAQLEQQYLTLKRKLADLLAACQNDEQREQATTTYTQARDNYWRALNHVFDQNDATVQQLTAELKAGQQQIDDAIEHLENIGKVLNTIAGVVSIGTRLASIVPV